MAIPRHPPAWDGSARLAPTRSPRRPAPPLVGGQLETAQGESCLRAKRNGNIRADELFPSRHADSYVTTGSPTPLSGTLCQRGPTYHIPYGCWSSLLPFSHHGPQGARWRAVPTPTWIRATPACLPTPTWIRGTLACLPTPTWIRATLACLSTPTWAEARWRG